MAKSAIDIAHLSRDERLELIEELWDSLSEAERESVPLTLEQQEELDRRLDLLEREGPIGVSADQLHEQIKRRSP
jgi:putative addiction module component (TIGR02574 family)